MAPLSVHFCPLSGSNRLGSCQPTSDRCSNMQTYEDLVELASICLRQARAAKSRAVAAELRRMAKEYQKRAAELVPGKLRDMGG
jgi:replication-associated recombination protein RarA